MSEKDVKGFMDMQRRPADEPPQLFVRQVEDRALPAAQVLTEQQLIGGQELPARNFVP